MDYRRIYESTLPQELTLIKLSFDEYGIRYRTHNENTLQIAQVGALGNHGATIEVAEDDYDAAKDILADMGIQLDYHISKDRFEFVEKFDHFARNVPGIQSLPREYRVVSLIAICIVILTLVIFLVVA